MTTKVLVSHGFGAGWSTWNTEWDDCATDETLVALIEAGDIKGAEEYAGRKWEGCYTGGIQDCVVEVVNTGELYQIHEYDGSESLNIFNADYWQKG